MKDFIFVLWQKLFPEKLFSYLQKEVLFYLCFTFVSLEPSVKLIDSSFNNYFYTRWFNFLLSRNMYFSMERKYSNRVYVWEKDKWRMEKPKLVKIYRNFSIKIVQELILCNNLSPRDCSLTPEIQLSVLLYKQYRMRKFSSLQW